MEIKEGDWFECIKEFKIGGRHLYIAGNNYPVLTTIRSDPYTNSAFSIGMKNEKETISYFRKENFAYKKPVRKISMHEVWFIPIKRKPLIFINKGV